MAANHVWVIVMYVELVMKGQNPLSALATSYGSRRDLLRTCWPIVVPQDGKATQIGAKTDCRPWGASLPACNCAAHPGCWTELGTGTGGKGKRGEHKRKRKGEEPVELQYQCAACQKEVTWRQPVWVTSCGLLWEFPFPTPQWE